MVHNQMVPQHLKMTPKPSPSPATQVLPQQQSPVLAMQLQQVPMSQAGSPHLQQLHKPGQTPVLARPHGSPYPNQHHTPQPSPPVQSKDSNLNTPTSGPPIVTPSSTTSTGVTMQMIPTSMNQTTKQPVQGQAPTPKQQQQQQPKRAVNQIFHPSMVYNAQLIPQFNKQMAVLRLMTFFDSINNSLAENRTNLAFWRTKISEFFSENAILKYTVSDGKTTKSFDLPAALLPRFYLAFSSSGIKKIQTHFEGYSSIEGPNCWTVEFAKAYITYHHSDGSLVTSNGYVNAKLDALMRIEFMEQNTQDHDEFVQRATLASLFNDHDKTDSKDPKIKTDDPDTKTVVLKSSDLTTKPKLYPYGVTEEIMTFLQISETLSRMQDIMSQSKTPNSGGPYKSFQTLATAQPAQQQRQPPNEQGIRRSVVINPNQLQFQLQADGQPVQQSQPVMMTQPSLFQIPRSKSVQDIKMEDAKDTNASVSSPVASHVSNGSAGGMGATLQFQKSEANFTNRSNGLTVNSSLKNLPSNGSSQINSANPANAIAAGTPVGVTNGIAGNPNNTVNNSQNNNANNSIDLTSPKNMASKPNTLMHNGTLAGQKRRRPSTKSDLPNDLSPKMRNTPKMAKKS